MAKITIDNIELNVSEARLAGILCASINMFELNPPYDIKVVTNQKLIKNNMLHFIRFGETFTLKESIDDVHKLCIKLMKPQVGHIDSHDESFLEMFTKNNAKVGFKYYLEDGLHDEFAKGYIWMGNHYESTIRLTNKVNMCEFLINSKRFDQNKHLVKLRVPAYQWNLPKITNIPEKHIVMALLELFLRDSDPNDHTKLIYNKTYIRFMLYQDNPDYVIDSYPYVYGYIRNIDQCIYKDQIDTLLSCPQDSLVCEVTFASSGYFYTFKADEWKNKKVNTIIEFI